MNPQEFRATLEELGLTQVGLAKMLQIDDRSVRRYALGERHVPKSLSVLLRLMIKRRIKPDYVASLE